MKKKLLVRLASIGGAIALSLGFAAVQSAEAGYSDCQANQVCVWRDMNYVIFLGWRSPGGGLVNVSDANKNKMSSWGNRTGRNAAWYYNPSGGSPCVTMAAGLSASYVYTNAHNDQMESWRTDRGC